MLKRKKGRSSEKSQRHEKTASLIRSRDYWRSHFGDKIFEENHVATAEAMYHKSKPYKHGVIEGLVNDALLRGVRREILSEIHYTQKETDIYKINQSGDLANLDGLDDTSLRKLPNLLKLRDALYSPLFREWLERVTCCGKLSGKKTDMAINIYTPGSHLLCHDDVIGSRRISYILYLTDPDEPWQEEWGGALRLYPTKDFIALNGKISHVPLTDASRTIFPQWNQLSFFAVQPGFSFHDVGEVYEKQDAPRHRQPMRVAISGWFHIPQPGEVDFVRGQAEALQKESSLTTLQSSDEQFDFPKPSPRPYPEYEPSFTAKSEFGQRIENLGINDVRRSDWQARKVVERFKAGQEDPDFDILTEEEAGFLCKIINPQFLAPDQAEEMATSFTENGHLVIEQFLHPKFAGFISHVIDQHFPQTMPSETSAVEAEEIWQVAKPPHKQCYLVMNEAERCATSSITKHGNEMSRLIDEVFRSLPFRKWLQIITSCIVRSNDIRIRRFRRGQDYQLARLYKAEKPRVEITLCLTPGGKWCVNEEAGNSLQPASTVRGTKTERNMVVEFEPLSNDPVNYETNHGGYEMFITGEEEDDEALQLDLKKSRTGHRSHLDVTGKQNRNKADPAIYQAAGEDEDDGILLNMAAGFNRLSIVLRDRGSMRFVKYVSNRAGYDRWDLTGEFEVDWERSSKVHGWDDTDRDED